MAKQFFLVLILLAIVIVSLAGCRGYGYRPSYGGGPHLDYMPEPTFPAYLSHRPVPYEELHEIYPADKNVSAFE